MIRNTILAAILISAIVLLVDGRVPKKACDHELDVEWGRAIVLRQSEDGVQRKPTDDEASDLLTKLQICRHFTHEFDLTSNLDGESTVWGTASLINLAVELDDVALLDELVEEGHSINGLPKSLGVSTLYVATYRQMEDAFRWSLDNGVDPNMADIWGISPLMLAVSRPQDHLASIRLLLDAGADIDAVSADGWNAPAIAIAAEKFDNALLLVESGADVALAKSLVTDKARTVPSEDARKEILAAIHAFENRLK